MYPILHKYLSIIYYKRVKDMLRTFEAGNDSTSQPQNNFTGPYKKKCVLRIIGFLTSSSLHSRSSLRTKSRRRRKCRSENKSYKWMEFSRKTPTHSLSITLWTELRSCYRKRKEEAGRSRTLPLDEKKSFRSFAMRGPVYLCVRNYLAHKYVWKMLGTRLPIW